MRENIVLDTNCLLMAIASRSRYHPMRFAIHFYSAIIITHSYYIIRQKK